MPINIFEELREIKSLIKKEVGDRWINIKELCDYTSLSESTIRRAVKRGDLKVSRKIGKLIFNIKDVNEWLNG